MANHAKDSMIMEYKDIIRQLNTTIQNQGKLIASLQKMLRASNAATANLQ